MHIHTSIYDFNLPSTLSIELLHSYNKNLFTDYYLPLLTISSLLDKLLHSSRNRSTYFFSLCVAVGDGGGAANIWVSIFSWATRLFSWANAVASLDSRSFCRSMSEWSENIHFEYLYIDFYILHIDKQILEL